MYSMGKGSKKNKSKSGGKFQGSANGGSRGSTVSTRNPSKSIGKGKKVSLPDRHLLEMW